MNIKIVTETETFLLNVNFSESVREIKRKIDQHKNYSMDSYRLIFSRKELEDNRKISDYHIENGSKVNLIPFIKGGH